MTVSNHPGSRIGLFGGTFNPIHNGHVRAAELVVELFRLDKVLLIPSFLPPHKKADFMAAPEHRLSMVKLAAAGHDRLEASSIEIDAGGTSYSVKTLEQIHRDTPRAQIYFIMGADAFLEIETWREYRRVIDTCRIIVISRPGYRLEEARNLAIVKWGSRTCEFSGKELQKPCPDDQCTIYIVEIDTPDVASTDIRNRIRDGLSITGMVGERIAKYIKENGLYLKKK